MNSVATHECKKVPSAAFLWGVLGSFQGILFTFQFVIAMFIYC